MLHVQGFSLRCEIALKTKPIRNRISLKHHVGEWYEGKKRSQVQEVIEKRKQKCQTSTLLHRFCFRGQIFSVCRYEIK